MKSLRLMTLMCGAVLISIGALGGFASSAPQEKEIAVVELPDKTMLVKTELQGKYIFVHDDTKMSKGESCLYVYKYSEDQSGRPDPRPDKLVVSFHCQPVHHDKATHIVLTYGMTPTGIFDLREIQFAGSTEGHRVP